MSDVRKDAWLIDLAQFAATFDEHPDADELRHRAERLVKAHNDTDLARLASVYEDGPEQRSELIRSAREVLEQPTRPMQRPRRILVGTYLVMTSALLLALTPWAWSVASRTVTSGTVKASLLGWEFYASKSFAFAAVVVLMALLGNVAVLILTFANRAGHETLERGYLWWYFTRPFAAAAVGLVLYMVVAAGYLQQAEVNGGLDQLTAAAALGGLAGLFTDKVLQTMSGVLGQSPFTTSTTDKPGQPTQP